MTGPRNDETRKDDIGVTRALEPRGRRTHRTANTIFYLTCLSVFVLLALIPFFSGLEYTSLIFLAGVPFQALLGASAAGYFIGERNVSHAALLGALLGPVVFLALCHLDDFFGMFGVVFGGVLGGGMAAGLTFIIFRSAMAEDASMAKGDRESKVGEFKANDLRN